MKYIYKLAIGDWSHDGHNQTDDYTVETNIPIDDIQQGYRDFVEKYAIALDSDTKSKKGKTLEICTNHEHENITKIARNALFEIGINIEDLPEVEKDEEDYYATSLSIAHLFMQMVYMMIPKLRYEFIDDKTPYINGYWGKLNVQIGYGCYYQC